MKFVYVVQRGFGEFSQAESFARYAKEQGEENIFITDNETFKQALNRIGFTTYLTNSSEEARKLIWQLNPDVLFHCNSKTTHMYEFSLLKNPPLSPKPFTVCFDSNWLWLQDERLSFQAPEWLDLIFVVMPEPIFQQGLYNNGGHFKISEIFRHKIHNPGFIPSGYAVSDAQRKKIRERLGINGQYLVFSYFGLKEDALIHTYLKCLEEIAPALNIKVFVKLVNHQQMPQYDWLITKNWLSTGEMTAYIASSDLLQ